MKKIILILLLLPLLKTSFCQISEGKSGVMTFNISKAGTDFRKLEAEKNSDVIPPKITLQTPSFGKDSLLKTPSKTLIVKGHVEDAGGIFEISVNGVEARVTSDGIFQAEIPIAIGKNSVTVNATDVSFNRSVLKFYTERMTSQIAEPIADVPAKTINKHSINVTSPSSDYHITANDKFTLQACIKSTASIKKIMISRDGNYVNGILSNNIIRNGDCAFLVEEPLALKLGMNNIKIDVFTSDDTISKNVIIEYSFYAARNFALLIGNEKYNDPNIPDLDEPVRDVTEMHDLLTKVYNFDPDNVTSLKNSTKAEIIGKLHELRSKITPSDNLLIFYAGHGYWDEGMGVGYWLPRDAAKNNPVNWIPNTDLTNYLGAIKTKHTLLIADACFSGGIFKTRDAFSATYAVEMLYQLNSRKAITSGNLTVVPDKSVFFQYLIKNLRENTNDYLSAEEMFSRMRMAIMNNSETVPRFGTIQNVGDEGGDFIFVRRKTGK